MSEPFLAQIVMFAGNFAPRGWAFCDGQLLPIAQNTAVFSLLGTTYGGDGRTTFGLPDMRGRVSMHPGNGPGLSQRRLGEKSGGETNTLTVAQLPAHAHTVAPLCNGTGNSTDQPTNGFPAKADENIYNSTGAQTMGATNSSNVGGGQAVNNVQPFTCVNYIIALQGVFPSRS